MVIMLAALLEYTRSPNRWRWAAAALSGVLWAFTRETNTYLLLALAVILALLALRKAVPTWRGTLALAAVFVLGVVIGQTALNSPQRWYMPFLHRFSDTILPYPQRVAYYQSLGMTTLPELLALAGPWTADKEQALAQDKALQPFATWYLANGQGAYASFLVTHPLDALSGPLRDWQMLVNINLATAYAPEGFRPLLPETIANLLYLKNAVLLTGALWVALVCCLWTLWKEGTLSPIAPLGFVLLFSVANYVLSWLGDSWEVERHILPAAVGVRLAAWLALLMAFDLLWQRQRDLRRLLTHPVTTPLLLVAGLALILLSLFSDRLTGNKNAGLGLLQITGLVLGAALLTAAFLGFLRQKKTDRRKSD